MKPNVIVEIRVEHDGYCKIVSALLVNKLNVREVLTEIRTPADKIPRKGVPLILMSITAGTGSEVSRTAVIINGEVKKIVVGSNIADDVTIVDPELTISLPRRQQCSQPWMHSHTQLRA